MCWEIFLGIYVYACLGQYSNDINEKESGLSQRKYPSNVRVDLAFSSGIPSITSSQWCIPRWTIGRLSWVQEYPRWYHPQTKWLTLQFTIFSYLSASWCFRFILYQVITGWSFYLYSFPLQKLLCTVASLKAISLQQRSRKGCHLLK